MLPKDAREATDAFVKRRQGDVLLNWETEAILARRKGEWTTPYKLFSPNVLTEQPAAPASPRPRAGFFSWHNPGARA